MKTDKITLTDIKKFDNAAASLYNAIYAEKIINVETARKEFEKLFTMLGSYYYGDPWYATNLKTDLTAGAYRWLKENYDPDFEYGAFRKFIFTSMFNLYKLLNLEVKFDIDYFNVD